MKDKLQIEQLVSEGVKEIIIRNGDALPQVEERVKLTETGSIKAPANYVEVIGFDNTKAVVVFSREKMEINFKEHPRHTFGADITGKLLLNPELVAFKIDTKDGIYTPKDLSDFLKRNAHHFISKSDNGTLVSGLRNFNAKVNSIIEQSGDQRGNIRNLFL